MHPRKIIARRSHGALFRRPRFKTCTSYNSTTMNHEQYCSQTRAGPGQPSTAVGCAPPRASPPRASPPRTCHLVPATSIQRRTCHLVPATSIRGADAAPRPSAMVSAMESAVVSAMSSAVTSAQPLTPCTDSASTPRQMQSWGTAPRMPRRRAVVSACMQGRSSVAISVPGPRMPRRRAGAP